jgi:hypothetical protein
LRKGQRFVASLDLLHIVEVAGIEKPGAKTRQGKFRFAAKHFLDARRQTAVPTGDSLTVLEKLSCPVVMAKPGLAVMACAICQLAFRTLR